MNAAPSFPSVSPGISAALTRQGFTALTPVQEAVLAPGNAGRDLRIRSQTGSGKTVAIGLVLAAALENAEPARSAAPAGARPVALPEAILIAPTRELAAQLARELTWLFAPFGAGVRSVTGGTGYGNEMRALREGPRVIVGTPGRLLDHLERGSIDPSRTTSVVLDEADQMLDLGFREDLTAILEKIPAERRTHLVSATFSREVRALADRYQKAAVEVEGTTRGEANQDIAHVAHLVRGDERDAALVNLLLLAPGERTLIFVRTREGASSLADRLSDAGFRARAIHGDLDQNERTATLAAFRSGAVTTLVATDVAARGIDVPDVSRVIHADPPGDADVFTHRSGRTGRAGRKGTSILLVPPSAVETVRRMLRFARVEADLLPAPTPADVLRAADARLRDELLAVAGRPGSDAAPASGEAAPASGEGSAASSREAAPASGERTPISADERRMRALAEQLLAEVDPTDLVAALLARSQHAGPCAPQKVSKISLDGPRASSAGRGVTGPRGPHASGPHGQASAVGAPVAMGATTPGFVPFRINWGERHGADARRLLALVCRRGGIRGADVGAIRIGDITSTFEVTSAVAAGFERSVKRPDERDPRIRIDPASPVSDARPAPRARSAPRTPYTPPRTRVAPPA
jgi:ATP-dependent RNA helicase DeaD